ncbi:SRPBCC domain-containing protein [Pararhodospirillum photometricum]|uniref:SRPBCC domain-containing protein n=1 Tax=Pararhodospirillum photometricum DSM 122 TaxID=1150469 RepID=H6SK95_PARPM|nr:SRPBCC domain-containing protein [Pararhodospirillum photometricum]CCG08410.1 Putative uncharacterized protein [Pararhodospirillum photometricum DSM 122]
MSSAVQTVCEINAPPSQVWQVLTDFPRIGTWNTVLQSIRGRAETGAFLLLTVKLEGRPVLFIPARVTECRPETELVWRGSLPGLFAGDHFFRLQAQPDNTTLLTHGEVFSGLLADTVMTPALRETSRRAYEAINTGLKAEVERPLP